MARYNADGSLDNTFGKNGFYKLDSYYGNCMLGQNDGKIVMAGCTQNRKFALARFINEESKIITPELTQNTALLYPNPTNGIFTLDLNFIKPGEVSMDIMNINGQLVNQFTHLDSQTINTIELKKQSPGIYFYKLYSENGIIKTGKIIFSP
jgi:hypothetical protein